MAGGEPFIRLPRKNFTAVSRWMTDAISTDRWFVIMEEKAIASIQILDESREPCLKLIFDY